MAPEALARRLTALLLVCGCAAACGRQASDISATWIIEPTPPVAGAATLVRLTLRQVDGTAVRGAKLKIEGHMSHPGMTPVVADVVDGGNGSYQARLHLSMSGDWVFIVSGELADGRRLTKDVAVPSVRPAR